MSIRDAFTAHPASVDETYRQHMGTAFGFGLRMIGGGIACLLHGLFPFLFTRTGSRTIAALHERMVAQRAVRADSETSSGPAPAASLRASQH